VNNNLVQDILTRINAEGKVELKELIRVMKESLPLLDLSEDTWEIYARTLVSWLRYVGLTNPNAITSDGRSMGVTKRGRQSEYFLPSSYVNQIISLMNKFGGRETIPLSELHEIRWAKSDCVKLGLIEETEPSVLRVTLTGEEFILNQFSRSRVFRDLLNSLDYMPKYLSEIDATKKSHLDVLKTVLGNTGFTEETWIWRSKILSNWLLFAGLVQREHGKIVRSSQPDFFNTQN
jgi:hypothetical protein